MCVLGVCAHVHSGGQRVKRFFYLVLGGLQRHTRASIRGGTKERHDDRAVWDERDK